MSEIKTASKLKFWPTPQDYNEAVQNPHVNLGDPELQNGSAATDVLGIPRPITGAFASVYKLTCGDNNFALRCFLRDMPDTQWRYGRIADYLAQNPLPYTVNFKFQFQGVRVAGKWFPVLSMDWVEGVTLDNHVLAQLKAGGLSSALSELFKTMCLDLQHAGIAHGDLQHGNIMVRDGQLVLVDYDGMYVPHINSPHSNELGHRNYQHPDRKAQHFGAYLDNFSAWSIYTSLRALALDPTLYERLGAGDDCLLFRRDDYLEPTNSCAFAALESSPHEEIADLARFLRCQLLLPPDKVEPLSAPPVVNLRLPPIKQNAPRSRKEQLSRNASAPITLNAPASTTAGSYPLPVPTVYPLPGKTEAARVGIEPELLKSTPRQLRINPACRRWNPQILQILVAMVPIFGLMLFSLMHSNRFGSWDIALADLSLSVPLVIIMSALVWWRPLLHKHIVRSGVAVTGTIVEKQLKRSTEVMHFQSTDWEHEKVKCLILYEYPRVRNGKVQMVRSYAHVSPEEYRDVDEGDQVTILYLPDAHSLIYKFSHYRAAP